MQMCSASSSGVAVLVIILLISQWICHSESHINSLEAEMEFWDFIHVCARERDQGREKRERVGVGGREKERGRESACGKINIENGN